MIFPTHHLLTAALSLVLVTAPSGARAQEVVQPLPGTTDADRLGDTMRQLASNPAMSMHWYVRGICRSGSVI
ncbi:hypothetical protein QP185_02815 [Sphingomonas aerolata]|uniref:hypothetical protein n=1 Tax=Sphingomonas aerolata TaxID=185951 RepID=UPI002FE42A4F